MFAEGVFPADDGAKREKADDRNTHLGCRARARDAGAEDKGWHGPRPGGRKGDRPAAENPEQGQADCHACRKPVKGRDCTVAWSLKGDAVQGTAPDNAEIALQFFGLFLPVPCWCLEAFSGCSCR